MDVAFENYRPLLFSIAYRMLGSAMEAEDIVQEAYLRYSAIAPETIRAPKAYLSKMITHLCLDQLKSAREQREQYIGPWLPEPLRTEPQPADADTISTAFLVLLESLSPAERAVFLLHEVFDYEYGEIAEMLDKEEAACRQLFHRAKQHITANKPRFKPAPEAHRAILGKFLQAVGSGDMQGLVSLLAEDVVNYADGGGKVFAARHPIVGRENVARVILGVIKHLVHGELSIEVAPINGEDAIIVYIDGKIQSVMQLENDGEKIHAIRTIVNPDKLHRVERSADD